MPKLEWKVLTKKRGSSTSQGIPPGKEDLFWVTGSVTLIYGQRDAFLVDTFLTDHPDRDQAVRRCRFRDPLLNYRLHLIIGERPTI